ncbi:phage baseplate assembly protein V [Lachnospiraceae bacterium 29-84]
MTVDGVSHIGEIRKIEITKKSNSHSRAYVEILLEEERLFQLQGMIGEEVKIEDERQIYMRGTIETVAAQVSYIKSTAVVTIVSFSAHTDEACRFRIFQDTEKTYQDVCGVISKKDALFQITDSQFSVQKEEGVLIQDGETDFAFMVSLAAAHGQDVFVNDTDTKCVINIGTYADIRSCEIKREDMLYYESAVSKSREELSIVARAWHELGTQATVEGKTYIVAEAKAVYQDGHASYSYVLRKELSQEEQVRWKRGPLGKARVVENKDPDHLGRIQVEFLEWEDGMPEHKIWMPYIPLLTEGGQGAVWIPDVGETVHVFTDHGYCYADGCVRQTALSEAQRNVQDRTFFVRNKAVTVNEKKVAVEGFSYRIQLEEDKLSIVNDNITIAIENDKITAGCNGTKLNLDAGTIQLLAKSKIDAKAGKIDMEGSSTVNVKTRSYNVG